MEVSLEDIVRLQGIRYEFCFKNNKIYRIPAKEQEEVRRIRSKYLPKEENKLDLLRRLKCWTSR